MLTDSRIRAAKPGSRPRSLSDGNGLLLKILPSGGRYWRFNYRFNGKQKTLALGVYPDVSLAKARERLYSARDLIADGIDPAARKRAVGKTFEIVAREWHARWSAHRHARYAHYVLRRLEEDVFPSIGARVPTEIPTSAFRDVVKRIEARGALEIARRVLQNCGQIMRYAVAHDYAARNPVVDVRPADILRPRKRRHYPRVGAKELPRLLIEQIRFAERALAVRYPEAAQSGMQPSQLLTCRRVQDTGDDLWSVFNRVQENLLVGGLSRWAASGRLTRTRRITSIRQDVRLNGRLWDLATEVLAA